MPYTFLAEAKTFEIELEALRRFAKSKTDRLDTGSLFIDRLHAALLRRAETQTNTGEAASNVADRQLTSILNTMLDGGPAAAMKADSAVKPVLGSLPSMRLTVLPSRREAMTQILGAVSASALGGVGTANAVTGIIRHVNASTPEAISAAKSLTSNGLLETTAAILANSHVPSDEDVIASKLTAQIGDRIRMWRHMQSGQGR